MRRILSVLLAGLVFTVSACRPAGLPVESPERDPTDPDAPIPAYRPGPSLFETSAFPAHASAAADAHEHHHHDHHRPSQEAESASASSAKEASDPPNVARPHEHGDHR